MQPVILRVRYGMKQEKEYHVLRLVKNLKYRLVWQGILVGIAAGVIVSLYRLLLSRAEQFSKMVYAAAKAHAWTVVTVFALLILIGIFVGYLTEKEPMIKGSGIPQVEGQILGFFQVSWWRIILGKIVGGVLAIGAGLSLGREGPSIQLGAAAGEGVAKGLGCDETEKRYLLTCGASAGLAAAFNAPLAGMLFSLEEVHKNFSVSVLLSALSSAVTADVVSKLFFGMDSVFGSHVLSPLPLRYYLYLPLLGILLGVCGWIYNNTLLAAQQAYRKITFLKRPYVMVIPFLFAGLFGFCLPEITGGGHGVVEALLAHKLALGTMALLLAAKFLFSMISFGSGAPGGIFFPLLVLGALAGSIFAKMIGLDEEYFINFVFLGMVGMFTAIVRAPVTGIVLIVEMSGSLTQMLTVSLVAVCAYLMADLMGAKPIYESLLANMRKTAPSATEEQAETERVLLNFAVETGCAADQKRIGELKWPDRCLLVSVTRGGEEIIPHGDTKMQTGDYVVVLCPKERESFCRKRLQRQFSKKG